MPDACPSLHDRVRAESDPGLRDCLLAHAAECLDCQTWLELWEERRHAGAARRLAPRAWRVGAAAAVLALVAGGFVLFQGARPGPQAAPLSFTLPLGDRVGLSGTFAAGPDAARLLTLPEGTRLRLEPGARIRFQSAQDSERVRLELHSGALEAEVAPGQGTFGIHAPAGEAQVLGTHLRVKCFELRPNAPCLCAEVYDGKVRLQNALGQVPVSGGERGILAGGQVPVKQRLGGTWKDSLGYFAALLQPGPDGAPPRVPPDRRAQAEQLAAILAGGRWDTPLVLNEASDDSPALREAKRVLREEFLR